MKTYNIGQNFNIVVSTKATLFGAEASDFNVYYAPVNDLTNITAVASGLTESIETVETAHTATLSVGANYGATFLTVDSGHDVASGDVIEYATGKFAYVTKAMDAKLYLRTRIRVAIASGATLTQVGNTGLYTTADFAVPTEGEYLISIEAPIHGVMVESRVGIVDNSDHTVVDGDAPVYSEVAVAY